MLKWQKLMPSLPGSRSIWDKLNELLLSARTQWTELHTKMPTHVICHIWQPGARGHPVWKLNHLSLSLLRAWCGVGWVKGGFLVPSGGGSAAFFSDDVHLQAFPTWKPHSHPSAVPSAARQTKRTHSARIPIAPSQSGHVCEWVSLVSTDEIFINLMCSYGLLIS